MGKHNNVTPTVQNATHLANLELAGASNQKKSSQSSLRHYKYLKLK